jgi:hypothetical protein
MQGFYLSRNYLAPMLLQITAAYRQQPSQAVLVGGLHCRMDVFRSQAVTQARHQQWDKATYPMLICYGKQAAQLVVVKPSAVFHQAA